MNTLRIAFTIASVALLGCASSTQKHMAKLADGREVDEFKYSSFQDLEDELKSRKLDDIDYRTERELIPKGGKLYLLEKKHYEANPVVSVSASDGKRSFKCDESEVSTTVVTPGMNTPQGLLLTSLGVRYDKSKTEITCDITMKLDPPIKFYLINTKDDTVSVYHFSNQ